ncbi:hypothetical protein D3C72_1062670 [compost metagenome]
MASERNACWRPEAKVVAVAMASAATRASPGAASSAPAAAAPRQPTVPVVWK